MHHSFPFHPSPRGKTKAPSLSTLRIESCRGMTLVELLFAVTLLSVILMMLFNLVNNTSRAVGSTERNLETWSELRAVLDRMTPDIASAVLREDLKPLYLKQTGNDAFYFYSFAEGYGGARHLSLAGYRVEQGKLQRGAQGTGWALPSVPFGHAIDASALSDSNYDTLGSHTFRLEIEFLGEDGTRTVDLPASTDWKAVKAIIVTLAAIDGTTLQQSGSSLEHLAALLPDPNQGETATEVWSAVLNSEEAPAAGKGIQLRERVFPVMP